MQWLEELQPSPCGPVPAYSKVRRPASAQGGDAHGQDTPLPHTESPAPHALVESGDLRSALANLRRTIEAEGSDCSTVDLINASMLAGRLGETDAADRYERLAAERDVAGTATPLANAALSAGRPARAHALLEQGATEGSIVAMVYCAGLALSWGERQDALFWYEQAAELGHEPSAWEFLRLEQARNIDADLKVTDMQATELLSSAGHLELGNMLFLRGNAEEGERHLRLSAEAGEVEAMRTLAGVYVNTGRTAEGEEWYERADDDGYVESSVQESLRINQELWEGARRASFFRSTARLRMVTAWRLILRQAHDEGWERAFVEIVCRFAADLWSEGHSRDALRFLEFAGRVSVGPRTPEVLRPLLLRRVVTEIVRLAEVRYSPSLTRALRRIVGSVPGKKPFSHHAALTAFEAARLDMVHAPRAGRLPRAIAGRWRQVVRRFRNADDPLAREHAGYAGMNLAATQAVRHPGRARRTFVSLTRGSSGVSSRARAGLALLPRLRIPRPQASSEMLDAQLRVRWWMVRRVFIEALTHRGVPSRERLAALRAGFGDLYTALMVPRNIRRQIELRHYWTAFQLWTSLLAGRPFILVLRNFDIDESAVFAEDDTLGDGAPGGLSQSVETEPLGVALQEALMPHTSMFVEVANNRPTDVDLQRPPNTLHLPDDAWMDTVRPLAALAAGIVVCGAHPTAGLAEELQLLRSWGRESDCVVLLRDQDWHEQQHFTALLSEMSSGAVRPRKEALTPGHPMLEGFPHVHETEIRQLLPEAADPLLEPVLSRLRAATAQPEEQRLADLTRRLERLDHHEDTATRRAPAE